MDEWIPVEERLPEIKLFPFGEEIGGGGMKLSDIVLTANFEDKHKEWPYECSRLDSGGNWLNWKFQPTHWKPIAPPTTKEKANGSGL